MSYGTDRIDLYQRAAGYADRILKGEKPADMPVQAPTRYQLITAKSLGLDVPVHLRQIADEALRKLNAQITDDQPSRFFRENLFMDDDDFAEREPRRAAS